MRTTINLPDELAAAAKRRASRERRTFTSLVEEALRLLLARPESEPTETPPLPTWGAVGGEVLVDLEDREAAWERPGLGRRSDGTDP